MDPLSNQGMRTPLAVIAVLIVVLLGGWIAFHEDETPAETASMPVSECRLTADPTEYARPRRSRTSLKSRELMPRPSIELSTIKA